MPELYIGVGLPGVGKTSLAHMWIKDHSSENLVISGDLFRTVQGGGKYKYIETTEPAIRFTMVKMAAAYLALRFNIWFDDAVLTNTKKKRYEIIRDILQTLHDIDVPVEVNTTLVEFSGISSNVLLVRRMNESRDMIMSDWSKVIVKHTGEIQWPDRAEPVLRVLLYTEFMEKVLGWRQDQVESWLLKGKL